jgi:TolA-binding protein
MTPSLSQVLTQGGTTVTALSISPGYLLAGLAFFSLVAFSAVRGLVLSRRSRLLPTVLPDDNTTLAEIEAREKLEKVAFLTDQLTQEKAKLAGQNSELQGKVEELNGALSNVKQTRDTLEKSNLALLKESERLKGEKERLTLKASVPLVALSPAPIAEMKKNNETKKTKLSAVRKIKKEGRRPSHPERARGKRVSRKEK